MKKFAIIVLASGTEFARALHSLLYAQELHEAGHDVRIIFDGEGTVWVKNFEDPANMYNKAYKVVKNFGLIAGVCEHCAAAFGVIEEVRTFGVATIGERNGHPSIAQLVAEDYQIITI